jgi:hypothetical protein
LSNQGKLVNKFNTDGKIFSSPIVLQNKKIVCSTMNGTVYFVNTLKNANLSAKMKPIVKKGFKAIESSFLPLAEPRLAY